MGNTPTTPTPAPTPAQTGTTAPAQGTSLSDRLRQMDSIFKPLSDIFQKMQSGGATAPTATIPGQVGSAPQPLATPPPQTPGVVPTPTIPQMGQVRPPVTPATPSLLFSTGFDHATKRGARGATVASAIQGVSSFVNKVKQEREEKQSREAQNLMSLLIEASKNPDTPGNKKIIGLIMNDDKRRKIIEKFFGEASKVMMEQNKPQKTSPELKGGMAAIRAAESQEKQGAAQPQAPPQGLTLPSPSPESRVTASGQETELLKQEAMRQGLRQAMSEGRGGELLGLSPLTPKEQRQMIFDQVALASKSLDQKATESLMNTAVDIYKADLVAETQIKMAKSDLDRAKIMAGPQYARVAMAKKILDSKTSSLDQKFLIEQNKMLTQTSGQFRNLASQIEQEATKMYDKDSDEYKVRMSEAAKMRQQANESDSLRTTYDDLLIQQRLGGAGAVLGTE